MRFQLLTALFLTGLAVQCTAFNAAAEDECYSEQRLVTRLKLQVQRFSQEKEEANRSLNELDIAETDADMLYGRPGQGSNEKQELESKIQKLAELCQLERSHGPSCEALSIAKREQTQLLKVSKKTSSKNQAMMAGIKNAQNGKAKETFEIEVNLRNAQSDLETAARSLDECKNQGAPKLFGSSASGAKSKKPAGAFTGGWSSF